MSWIKFFIFLIVILLGLGFFRTYQIQNDPRQKQFLAGKVPKSFPSGIYKGWTDFWTGPWEGKIFDTKKRGQDRILGNNIFRFGISVSKGELDKNMRVIKLDYGAASNIFPARFHFDEIVEVKSGLYLGKAYLRVIPGYPFALIYFWLRK